MRRFYIECRDECQATKALWLATSCRLICRQMKASRSNICPRSVDIECRPSEIDTIYDRLYKEGVEATIQLNEDDHHDLPNPEETRLIALADMRRYSHEQLIVLPFQRLTAETSVAA